MRTHPHYDILFQELKNALLMPGTMDELQILEAARKMIEDMRAKAGKETQATLNTARQACPNTYMYDIYQSVEAMASEIRRLREQIETYKKFIGETVEPLRQEAMEVSEKYEPCGYYCDPHVGHVDHRLYNHAKFLYRAGDGKTYSIPDGLLPEALQEDKPQPGKRF